MKYLFITLLIATGSFLYSQSITNPQEYFEIDTSITFSHFGDIIEIRKLVNGKEMKIDTIYSADIDTQGRIIAEFYNESKVNASIVLHHYNSQNRKDIITTYKQSWFKDGENGLIEINVQFFKYNEFDSVYTTEDYTCFRNKKQNNYNNLKTEGVNYPSMKDYSNDWKWSFSSFWRVQFDSLQRPSITRYYLDDSTYVGFTELQYDKLGRIKTKKWVNFSFTNSEKRDTTKYQLLEEIKYFYDTSYVFIEELYDAVNTYIKTEIKKELNGEKQIVRESTRSTSHNRLNGDAVYANSLSETNFSYDKQGRISSKSEIYKFSETDEIEADGNENSSEYQYYYKESQ